MDRLPQVLVNVAGVERTLSIPTMWWRRPVSRRPESRLGDSGRVLLRKSGTEPLVRDGDGGRGRQPRAVAAGRGRRAHSCRSESTGHGWAAASDRTPRQKCPSGPEPRLTRRPLANVQQMVVYELSDAGGSHIPRSGRRRRDIVRRTVVGKPRCRTWPRITDVVRRGTETRPLSSNPQDW